MMLVPLLLLACGRQGNRFRLEAQFKNLNQGEFYVYSLESGHKDTIAVNDGRFVFERTLTDSVTLCILFPNYSEMPVFAAPGAKVKMEGDASHLRETTINGTKENDAMTVLRLKMNELLPDQVQQTAEQYIREHPESPVSIYLLHRYFLQAAAPSLAKADELCGLLHEAQPQNQHLARLNLQLGDVANINFEGQLPVFGAVDTKGDSVSNKKLNGTANVILAWASWNNDSQAVLSEMSEQQRQGEGKVKVMAICLDASPAESKKFIERDSIVCRVVCDSLMWQSPLLSALGINDVPANILADKEGNIVARNLSRLALKDSISAMLARSDRK